MAASYDLFVLLDPEAPEERRTAIVDQLKRQIDAGGATLKGDADWGMRRLAYEIDHRREAQYHLFQFKGPPEVLAQLDRSLSIDDSVLRHRIIRLPGEAPEQTPGPPEETPRRMGEDRPRDGGRDRRGEREAGPDADAAEAPAPAPAAQAEPGATEPEPGATAPEAEPQVPPEPEQPVDEPQQPAGEPA